MQETAFLAALFFLLFALISGSLIQFFVSKVKAYKPPVSILWFLWGMAVCTVEIVVERKIVGRKHQPTIEIDPNKGVGLLEIGIAEAARVHSSVLYYILLPVLLYDATQEINWHYFRKTVKVGALLAVAGVILQVGVIGTLMKFSFDPVFSKYDNTVSMRRLSADSPTEVLPATSIATFSGISAPVQSVADDSAAKLAETTPGSAPSAGASFDSIHFGWDQCVSGECPSISLPPVQPPSRLEEAVPVGTATMVTDAADPETSLGVHFFRSVPSLTQSWIGRRLGSLWDGGSNLLRHSFSANETGQTGWSFSMMTAAAVASTDPIAVISILEEMDAPPRFGSLFDSEALINDGSSIFLFTFFKALAGGSTTTVGDACLKFMRLLFLGPCFGFLIASILYRWLKHFRWYPYDETIAVLFTAYLVFAVGEIFLETSGPLAIVAFGLYFKAYAKAAFNSQSAIVHHHLTRGFASMCTSVVFIVSGIASARMMWDAFTREENLHVPDDLPDIETEERRRRLQAIANTTLLFLRNAQSTMQGADGASAGFGILSGGSIFGNGMSPIPQNGLYSATGGEPLSGSGAWASSSGEMSSSGTAPPFGGASSISPASLGRVSLISGSAQTMLSSSLGSEVWRVPVFYIYLLLARFIMIGIFYPLINRLLGSFTWREGLLLGWGGLRGSICLILALLIEQDANINKNLSTISALLIASSAFLFLFINGISFEFFYRILKPYRKVNPFKKVYLNKVMILIDKEYNQEINLLHKHWLFQKNWALIYADRLIPKLTTLQMDSIGKLHLGVPSCKKVLHALEESEKRHVLPISYNLEILDPNLFHPPPYSLDYRHSVQSPSMRGLSLPKLEELSPQDLDLQLKRASMEGRLDAADLAVVQAAVQAEEGPEATAETAAVLQRIRGSAPLGLDLASNLRVLDIDEKESLEEPKISARQMSRLDSAPAVQERAASEEQPLPTPLQPDKSEVNQDTHTPQINASPLMPQVATPLRRVPGYRYDSIVRIRSEPFAFDAAVLERPGASSVYTSLPNVPEDQRETASTSSQRHAIKRTMSVPNSLQASVHELADLSAPSDEAGKLREREGEIIIMVSNAMRQLYRRMHEQSFISGTALIGFMTIADIVADYALLDVMKVSTMKVWRDVMTAFRDTQDKVQAEIELITQEGSDDDQPPLNLYSAENVTGFDIEWALTLTKLRGRKNTLRRLRKFKARINCLRSNEAASMYDEGIQGDQSRFRKWKRAACSRLWSLLGPRQTFPALDDLQVICAFVDVHEELLMRGDCSLRVVLGEKLLSSVLKQVSEAKKTAGRLHLMYPTSYPYAIICHAAIFLANLKIQLVEEQYEKGLLLLEDKNLISSVLKEQIIQISKFHPPVLFS